MLSSPDWWVAAIIAGLLMSVLAAYVKQGLDRLLALSSKTWRDLRRSQKQDRTDRVARASEDPHFFMSLVAREMRVRFRLICYLVAGFGLHLFAIGLTLGGLKLEGLDSWFLYRAVPTILLLLWTVELWALLHARLQVSEAEGMRRERHPRATT